MLSIPATTVRDSINKTNPNSIAEFNRLVKLGNVLSCTRRCIYKAVPTAAGLIVLDPSMKCARLLEVRARAGTSALGALAIQTVGATPATTQVAQTHSGDVQLLNTDAYTSVDVEYEPLIAEVATVTKIPVASNTCALPGAITLSSVIGYKADGTAMALTVSAPGGGATTGLVALAASRESVVFAAADAIVFADIVYAKAPSQELGAVLNSVSTML